VVERSITAERLVTELETGFAATGGPPKVLRMDNGPELVSQVVIGDFKHQNNRHHRHSALGYRTPAEYAAAGRHTHTPVACTIN